MSKEGSEGRKNEGGKVKMKMMNGVACLTNESYAYSGGLDSALALIETLLTNILCKHYCIVLILRSLGTSVSIMVIC